MKTERPVTCEAPTCAATLEKRTQRVRRGDRSTTAPGLFWACSGCVDPVAGGPLEFVDAAMMAQNDEAARDAWERAFGEPLLQARLPAKAGGAAPPANSPQCQR